MSHALDDFLPFVEPWARGASDLACLLAVRRAGREFIQRSQAWRVWLTNQSIVAAQAPIVTLTGLPTDSMVESIHGVRLNDRGLEPDTADSRRALCITDESTGCPLIYKGIDVSGLTQVNLLPLAEVDYTNELRVWVWLMPTQACATLPDWLFTRHADALGYLAAAILNESGEDWAQPNKATYYRSLANAGINAANHWAQSNAASDAKVTTGAWR